MKVFQLENSVIVKHNGEIGEVFYDGTYNIPSAWTRKVYHDLNEVENNFNILECTSQSKMSHTKNKYRTLVNVFLHKDGKPAVTINYDKVS
jgi:hypothetical protein